MMRFFRPAMDDVICGSLIAAMAAGSAAFPFYVASNPAKFGPPEMVYSAERYAAEQQLAALGEGSVGFDLAQMRLVPGQDNFDGVDLITTGTIARDAEEEGDQQRVEVVSRDLRLLSLDGQRALVADSEGIYLVGPSSRLPGGGVVRSVRRTDGNPALVTSLFQVIELDR